MIDIHSHILYGVDDGSDDIETSMEMARIAAQNGVKTIVATPHYIRYDLEQDVGLLRSRIADFNIALKESEINIEVLSGMEVYITPDLIELIEQKKILTINNTRYLLLELPLNSMPNYVEDIIYNLRLDGYTPVLAHPERNMIITKQPDKIKRLINLGAIVQCNAGSIRGRFGSNIKDTAQYMVKQKLVHVVASDCHGVKRRTPRLTKAYTIVEELVGQEYADKVFKSNPSKIVNDMEIESTYTVVNDDVRVKGFKYIVNKILNK